MTGIGNSAHDDEHLARRLRDLDPAREVAPLPEHRIEEIMTRTTTQYPSDDTQPIDLSELKDRRRTRLAAGFAAVAAAAAIVTAVVISRPAPGETLALDLPPDGGAMMSCLQITPDVIAGNDVAFEGRVTSIDGDNVTLEVLHQYTGEAASAVTIPQGTDDLIELTIGRLEVGETYLISAVDGVVATCGQSGVSSPELKAIYEAAFS